MKKKVLAAAIVLFIISGWSFFLKENNSRSTLLETSQGLIRLHVLANSDSPEDQQLKLKVRDAILAYLSPQLEQAGSSDSARSIILNNKDKLVEIAQQVIKENGADYSAQLEMGMFDFPIKSYGDLILPAGKYEAVRILIGAAQGKNWWCVLFPPLCFIDITNAAAATSQTGTDAQGQPAKDHIEIHWKLWEALQQKS